MGSSCSSTKSVDQPKNEPGTPRKEDPSVVATTSESDQNKASATTQPNEKAPKETIVPSESPEDDKELNDLISEEMQKLSKNPEDSNNSPQKPQSEMDATLANIEKDFVVKE